MPPDPSVHFYHCVRVRCQLVSTDHHSRTQEGKECGLSFELTGQRPTRHTHASIAHAVYKEAHMYAVSPDAQQQTQIRTCICFHPPRPRAHGLTQLKSATRPVQNWLRLAAARLTQTRILRPAKDVSDCPSMELPGTAPRTRDLASAAALPAARLTSSRQTTLTNVKAPPTASHLTPALN